MRVLCYVQIFQTKTIVWDDPYKRIYLHNTKRIGNPPMKFDASPSTFYLNPVRNFRDRMYGTSYTHFKVHIYFKGQKKVYQGTLHTKITKII
jgi:hypothetical protein